MRLPPLPSTGELIRLYGLSAKKQLSQNFILDSNLCRRIARTAAPLKGRTFIDVGSGPGSLARGLLQEGARKVIAVEKDPRFVPALQMLSDAAQGRMHVVVGDMLELDEEQLVLEAWKDESEDDENKPVACVDWSKDIMTRPAVGIVGNLPFSVGTELLVKWLYQMEQRKGTFRFGRGPVVLTFQDEVARRVSAAPGCREFTRLSVMSQVNAGVVRLDPLASPKLRVPLRVVEDILRWTFSTKRKSMSNALLHTVEEVQLRSPYVLSPSLAVLRDSILEETGIDGGLRPEQVSVEEWMKLCGALENTVATVQTQSLQQTLQ